MSGSYVPNNTVRNVEWHVWKRPDGYDNEAVMRALLIDIRAEMRKLNNLLGCSNFTDIPRVLRKIRANTTKPRKKRAAKRPVTK